MLTLRGPKSPRIGSELNQLSIIQDGSLLVRDGVVEEVGPTRRVENLALARQAIEVSAAGRVVMPGFVDSHTHLVFPVPGGPAGDRETEVRTLHATTALQLKARARTYLQAMARHGTTTVEVKTGCGADANAEMKILRVLADLREKQPDVVPSFLFRLAPTGYDAVESTPNDWRWVCSEFLPKIRRRRLADFADLLWDGLPSHAAALTSYWHAARRLELGCKLHADTAQISAAAVAAAENRAVSIDHLERATAADATAVSQSGAVATLLPCASFHDGGHMLTPAPS